MREKKTKARWKGILAFTGIFLVLFLVVSDIMSVSDCTSLANIRGFYMEPKNSLDVAMIGPSEFYADYSATQAWQEYGYTSYSLAVAGVPGNLYKSMLKEVQKRQSPKLVVFEVNGFLQGDDYFAREGQLHTWLDNIPWSENKIETIKEMIPENEQYSYFCKIAAAHNNWKDIGQVAILAGNPHWARVVGYALHANPQPGVIPCHRVVGAGGRLTGYAWGLERKKALLDLEQGHPL